MSWSPELYKVIEDFIDKIRSMDKATPEPLFYSDDNQPVFDKDHVYQVYKMYDKIYCHEVISDAAEFKARGKVPSAKYFINKVNATQYIIHTYPNYISCDYLTRGDLWGAVYSEPIIYPTHKNPVFYKNIESVTLSGQVIHIVASSTNDALNIQKEISKLSF